MKRTADGEGRLQGERVLVVDDDIGIAQCISLILGKAGYPCVVCSTGAEAFEKLRSSATARNVSS